MREHQQPMRRIGLACVLAAGLAAFGCGTAEHADILLVGGRVYTFTWPEPDRDGRPASGAPHDTAGWRPDAQAVALRGDRIMFVGQRVDGEAYRGPSTRVIDLKGATVLPGLIDSHVHLPELGASLERVNLVGVQTEAEAVERVAVRARAVPRGEWIVGWGWDEGFQQRWSNISSVDFNAFNTRGSVEKDAGSLTETESFNSNCQAFGIDFIAGIGLCWSNACNHGKRWHHVERQRVRTGFSKRYLACDL